MAPKPQKPKKELTPVQPQVPEKIQPQASGAISFKKSVTTVEEFNGQGADLFDIRDNAKGVSGRLPQIKIVHQGCIFMDSAGVPLKSFEGIIIDHSPANAWWETAYAEGGAGSVPDCFSLDGITPQGEKVQCKSCKKCQHNQYGTKVDQSTGEFGRGKACSNKWRLHILRDGQLIPVRLTVPASSIGVVEETLIGLLSNNIVHELAIVEFKLKSDKNKDGVQFAKLEMAVKGVVNDRSVAEQIVKMKKDFAQAFGEVILSDESEENA